MLTHLAVVRAPGVRQCQLRSSARRVSGAMRAALGHDNTWLEVTRLLAYKEGGWLADRSLVGVSPSDVERWSGQHGC